jgi:hypothetical protein
MQSDFSGINKSMMQIKTTFSPLQRYSSISWNKRTMLYVDKNAQLAIF